MTAEEYLEYIAALGPLGTDLFFGAPVLAGSTGSTPAQRDHFWGQSRAGIDADPPDPKVVLP